VLTTAGALNDPSQLAWSVGPQPLGAVLGQSDKPDELSQWLYHDDRDINIVLSSSSSSSGSDSEFIVLTLSAPLASANSTKMFQLTYCDRSLKL